MTGQDSDLTLEKNDKVQEALEIVNTPASAEAIKEALAWHEYLLCEQEKGSQADKVALRAAGGTSVSGG